MFYSKPTTTVHIVLSAFTLVCLLITSSAPVLSAQAQLGEAKPELKPPLPKAASDQAISSLKLSAENGEFIWAKQMGGTDYYDGYNVGYAITLDATGNVYTTGSFSGTADFDPGPGIYTMTGTGGYIETFVSKLDSSGNFIWAKQMGRTDFNQGDNLGAVITLDAAGNVYITGSFSGTADFDPGPGIYIMNSASPYNIFVSKLDGNGNFIWAKQMGGVWGDVGKAITLDAVGNIYTTGYFTDTADFDPGPGIYNMTSAGSQDIFVSKLDSSGNFMWAKQMGGIALDEGAAITLDAAGNVYTTGYFTDTADFDPGPGIHNMTSVYGHDIFVSKLDSSGNFIWAKQMGGELYNDAGNAITLDTAGNVYTTGYFSSSADFDPGPGIHNLTSAGGKSIFVSKLDSSGNFIWAIQLEGDADDIGNAITLDTAGNVYTTGWFLQVDFDPGPGTYILTSAGYDIFVSKLDSSGNFIWAKQMGGAAYDIGNAITLDATGNVYTTGSFQTTADFDPGPDIYNMTGPTIGGAMMNTFISKLGFVDDTTPPSVPSLLSPGDGMNMSNNTPTFDWSDSTGSPTEYHLLVDNNSDFSSPEIDTLQGVSTYTPASALADGTYWWKVRARDAVGNWSNYSISRSFSVQITQAFTDVSTSYWAWQYIDKLYNANITGGCGTNPLIYCPETTVTRSQMAVFLLRGIHGSSYSPPSVGGNTGFGDVPTDYWSASWIKQLAAEGITGGCGSGNYCPEYPVTRDQMAVFLLRSKYGSSYSPPPVGASTGFGDVPTNHWAAAWIKQLVTEGITAGCGSGNYCPETPVTRAQMAVFLVRTFGLP